MTRGLENHGGLPGIPRPIRILSRLNRSSVFPPLVPEKVDVQTISLNEILAALQANHQHAPPHRLLDLLATASGLSSNACAQILFTRKLINRPIDFSDIAAVRSAREFRTGYYEGRARYAALLTRQGVVECEGDWAYFDDRQLLSILPGIIVPTRLRRDHYLTNLVSMGDYACVDVHAVSAREPLFQHPFFPDFNPLVFGKPPAERQLP